MKNYSLLCIILFTYPAFLGGAQTNVDADLAINVAYNIDLNAIRNLLNSGANPNYVSGNNTSTLYKAIFYGNLEGYDQDRISAIRLLIHHGGDLRMVMPNGKTPLDELRKAPEDMYDFFLMISERRGPKPPKPTQPS